MYWVTVQWSPGTYGERISESNSASGPFTVVTDTGYQTDVAGDCPNHLVYQNGDPLGSTPGITQFHPGQTYYFQVIGYTGPTITTTVSSTASVTIPTDNGDAGQVFLTPTGPGTTWVNWTKPVQGYKGFVSTNGGPFVAQGNTGFQIDQEDTGFGFSASPGSTYCWQIQGYSQTGASGTLEGGTGTACATL